MHPPTDGMVAQQSAVVGKEPHFMCICVTVSVRGFRYIAMIKGGYPRVGRKVEDFITPFYYCNLSIFRFFSFFSCRLANLFQK